MREFVPCFSAAEYVTDMGNSPSVSTGVPTSFGCKTSAGSIRKRDKVLLPEFTVNRYYQTINKIKIRVSKNPRRKSPLTTFPFHHRSWFFLHHEIPPPRPVQTTHPVHRSRLAALYPGCLSSQAMTRSHPWPK